MAHTLKIQIRFLGFKGMICKDESLTGCMMGLRPSQDKFDEPLGTDEAYIEIANTFTKPKPVYLNRYATFYLMRCPTRRPFFLHRALVMILEDRSVDARFFLELQERAVAEVRSAPDAFNRLRTLFKTHSLGTAFSLTDVITRLDALQVNLRSMQSQILQSPFFGRVARCSMNTLLRDMKYRCRIPIPQSWKLAGVVDEGPTYEENKENASRKVLTLEKDEIFGK